MSPKTLTGRRQVVPLESHAASLPGWTLSFRMLGLPYAEPGFATIERVGGTADGAGSGTGAGGGGSAASASASVSAAPSGRWRSEVHGVLHKLRPADWATVMATEGVGSADSGYKVVEVEVRRYDGTTCRALTLEGQTASLHSPGRGRVAPSQRYLGLLRDGARHHGLDPEYITFLDSLEPYDGSGVAPAIGRAAAIAVAAPFALPLLPPVLLLRYLRKQEQQDKQAPPADAAPGGSNSSGGATAAPAAAGASAVGVAMGATGLAPKAAAVSSGAPPATPAAAAAAVRAAAGGASANGTSSSSGGAPSVPKDLLQPPATMPAVVGKYINAVQSLTWLAHDILAAPLLGSGSSSSSSNGVNGIDTN
ncbi:hypothetical protein HYH02_014131 [Chlamydomonas schloesseri]|uniref:gamma-glutamylcyclotransferase n=1 Tax=Chlamydomonas schloesseri TaxID=2026947 RepID=A0A835SVW1_9CHLO|nr:hypothetical protein HYH02_014131 [Chlamydomonas schloesseri]|eukprot:KAG2429199.1 hypothetical protein HYH02_014131 [Chlamydomonas schloesseri]